jgi:hypothetical protein
MTTTADEDSTAAEPKSTFGAVPSPLDAVDDMRAAAKWMLAAAGAVGATLISGGTLVAIGQVHGALHITLAVVGLVLALSGVGVAIWYTSDVLMPRLTTPAIFRSLRELDGLRGAIDREPAEFFGVAATTVEGLFVRQDALRQIAASLAGQAAREEDPGRRAQYEKQLRRVERNGELLGQYARSVLALGHAWRIAAALARARVMTLAGAGLVIAGAALFFSSTSSNGPTYVPVVTTVPSPSSAPAPAPTR